MEYVVVWLVQSLSWLTMLFAAFGLVYVLTQTTAAARSSAWDSWLKREIIAHKKPATVQSIVPPAVMLIAACATAGFFYGFFDKSAAMARLTHMGPGNALKNVIQTVVFEPRD